MKKRMAVDIEYAAKAAEAKESVQAMTDAFCDAHLNAEYKRLCRKAIAKIARTRPSPFLKGRPNIWAAGLVHAIGSANFLFDKSFQPYISAVDLSQEFGVKPGSAAQKAAAIRDVLELDYFRNYEFTTRRMKADLAPMEEMIRQTEVRLIAEMTSAPPPASRPKAQGGEFVDGDHPVMDRYYELMENYSANGLSPALQRELQTLIQADPDFYDPYLILGEGLSMEGRNDAAAALLETAYTRALRRVTDAEGNWPQSLEWGWMENRHIIRTFLNVALALWSSQMNDAALDLFRKLLRSNPNDNIGARDYILAIRLGMTNAQYEKKFASRFGYDALKLIDWFDENVSRFPDEFDWWKEAVHYDVEDAGP